MMSNCKKSLGSGRIVAASVLALVVAGAIGGYVYAINKTKQKFDENIKTSVEYANLYANQQKMFSMNIKRSDADSSFNHDKYVVSMLDYGSDSDLLKINMDCNYGVASVTSDLKFDFGALKESSDVFKKIEDSITGRFDFSALSNASSLTIDMKPGEHKSDSLLIKWNDGSFKTSVDDYTKPTAGKANFNFSGISITDSEDNSELSLSKINADFGFEHSSLKLDNLSLKHQNKDVVSIKNVDFNGKTKLNVDDKKVSFELNYGTEKAYIDQLLSSIGSFDIDGFKFGFHLNNLSVSKYLEKCNLQNTKEDWVKITDCLGKLSDDDVASVSLDSIKNIDGNMMLETKLNASNLDFKLDYKINSDDSNVIAIMTSIVLNAELKFDKSLFDNVPLLSSYKDMVINYVEDDGSKYKAQLNCAEGKCNLNGKKLF